MTKKLELDLGEINLSLLKVEKRWPEIDNELDKQKIGRKDIPFDRQVREQMMCAYEYVNQILSEEIVPFSLESFSRMLELNNMVHYGKDYTLRLEENKAILTSRKKFYDHIGVLEKWYRKHKKRGDHPLKLASEIYVGIVGYPQLFVEGNHRTGSVIASWIDVYNGYAPFILSPDNAISFFKPSSEIKHFSDKSTWRGRLKLPKYKKSFREFWEDHIDDKYLKKR
ncbi:MAG: hypothetical protein WCI72_04765 [archaeon]